MAGESGATSAGVLTVEQLEKRVTELEKAVAALGGKVVSHFHPITDFVNWYDKHIKGASTVAPGPAPQPVGPPVTKPAS